jgi:radical SAM superfamily enzyme YgiQ (UPF0313 family)
MLTPHPRQRLRTTLAEFRPDVIGLSVRNVDDQSMNNTRFLLEEAREVVDDCRALSSAPVVLGGAGYSIFPEALLDYLAADMGIQGEGESAFCELLSHMKHKEDPSLVPGLFLAGRGAQAKRTFVKDLDRLPLPSPSMLSLEPAGEDFWLPVQTRRGCPLHCSYCSTPTIEGSVVRQRSPQRVIGWLQDWVAAGIRRFYFVDNTFNLPLSYAKALCREMIGTVPNIVWRCILYPGMIDEELVSLMADAGCREASLGFESGSQLILRGMNKRFSADDARKAAKALADHGIRRMGFLMLGGPGETKESALESLAYADSLDLGVVKITVGIRIYPYTALAGTAVEEGVITEDDNLLTPHFYVTKGLSDWLEETVQRWMTVRPHWIR